MQRKAEMEAIRQHMEGVIALLLSLAAIAERACLAPLPVTARVVWLLQPAETVAWDYVCGQTGLPALLHGDDPCADAAALAVRFRFFAAALAGMVVGLLAGSWHCVGFRSVRRLRDAADAINRALGCVSPNLLFDTS